MDRKRWLLPSLDSYRGQHALLATILTALLLAVSWFGYTYVQQVSVIKIDDLEKRSIAAINVSDIRDQLRDLEQWLQWQIISPTDNSPTELQFKLRNINTTLARSMESELITDHPMLHNVSLALNQDFKELVQVSSQLIDTMGFQATRFPGTVIMQDEMLPHTREISTILNTLAYELSLEGNGAGAKMSAQLLNLRNNWQNVVLEFRLYVANRFGVFSESPRDGMAARADDMQLHRELFYSNLDQLRQAVETSDLLVDESVWVSLKSHADSWFIAFQKLSNNLNSNAWRKDLQVFRDLFLPVIERMKMRIAAMELELDTQASEDITSLTDIAGELSVGIVYLAILGMMVVLLGYFYLKYRLILPIAHTTEVLKAEAQGIGGQELPSSTLQETRNLVDAFREMREQVRIRQLSLDHMAHHDALTQLPNRVLFRDRLQQAIRLARRHNQQVGLMFLDLDRFKQVNDSLGHIAGDKLLIHVARRLRRSIRESDTAARLSGDEFAILAEDIQNREEMAELGKKILTNLERTFSIQSNNIHISASIGIAISPDDYDNVDDLIRAADAAMYEAKARGKANYQFYSANLAQQASERLQLEHQLRESYKNDQFIFHFQPVVDMRTGSPICFEALIRWLPEPGKVVYPNTFLDNLLETGMIAEVTGKMLTQIATAQQLVMDSLNIPVHINLNVSGPILRSTAAYTTFLSTLCDSGIKRDQLTIEITEDTLIEDISHAEQFLRALKKENIQIALDDFGTGQSSLSHVRMFPFDLIKIDKEFVRDIRTDPNDASLVKVIIQLAHNFGMQVVAEGVENAEQFEFLLHANCDMAQGFMIDKPMPVEDMVDYLRQQASSLVAEAK
ncbi:MAG: putative bifunctional diguanylate cyclase/phosphodiesterase [bacterium]